MAKALMLWPSGTGVRIGSTEGARLAALGVTNVSLLRDAETVAMVLEGWAFNPARSAWAAAAVLGDVTTCRVLSPALDVAVTNANEIGGIHEPTVSAASGDAGSRRAHGR